MRMKFWILVGSLVVAGVLVGFFVTRFLNPEAAYHRRDHDIQRAPGSPGGRHHPHDGRRGRRRRARVNGEHPNWVGYLPTTYLQVPAGAVVHMTIDQQDGQTGLRNEYFGLVRGTINDQMTVNGKVMSALDPTACGTHVHDPRPRRQRPARGRRRQRARERPGRRPIRLRRAGHQGSLPVAVLRPLRRGDALRQRRTDADARLHGRRAPGGLNDEEQSDRHPRAHRNVGHPRGRG